MDFVSTDVSSSIDILDESLNRLINIISKFLESKSGEEGLLEEGWKSIKNNFMLEYGVKECFDKWVSRRNELMDYVGHSATEKIIKDLDRELYLKIDLIKRLNSNVVIFLKNHKVNEFLLKQGIIKIIEDYCGVFAGSFNNWEQNITVQVDTLLKLCLIE